MTREEAIEYLVPLNEEFKKLGFNRQLTIAIDALLSNPWHKASEELPTRFGDYLVVIKSQQFGRRCALKCWYGYPKDPFGDNPSKEWVLEDDEIVTHWMEIPEIKEE